MDPLEFLEKTKTEEMFKEEPKCEYEKTGEVTGWYGKIWQTKQTLVILDVSKVYSQKKEIEINSDAIHILNIMRMANKELTLDSLIDYIRKNLNSDMVSGLSGFMATMLERYMDIWTVLGIAEHVTKPGTDRGKYANSTIQVEGIPEGDRVYKFNSDKTKLVQVKGLKPFKNKTVGEGITFLEVSILAALYVTLGGKTDIPETDWKEIERYYPITCEELKKNNLLRKLKKYRME